MKKLISFFYWVLALLALGFSFLKMKKRKERPGLQSENIRLKVKLQQIEAQDEIENDFKNKSDRQIVLDAINAESSKRKPES